MKTNIGRIEINVYDHSASITKHYNDSVSKTIDLDEDDIIHIEFAISEIKRQMDLFKPIRKL